MSIFKNTFKPEIQSQLNTRQNSLQTRDVNSIKYLNSRNAWIRMTSSVDVDKDNGKLAREHILQGGTLYNDNLRAGVGENKAYSFKTPSGQTHQRGLRPMPGINSIDIKSKSAYGSLREVVVKFQCWDITQLEDLELLYMRPGYTVLIEWGWLPYLDNKNNIIRNLAPYDGMFTKGNTKEKIWSKIFQKSLDSNGNYDAMFGYVKNYSWSAREDGGYDCTTTIISIGEIIESLKINYAPQNIKSINEGSGLIFKNITEATLNRYKKNILAGLFAELYEKVNENFKNESASEGIAKQLLGSDYFILNLELKDAKIGDGKDDLQLVNQFSSSKQIYIRLGSLIDILNKHILLKDKLENTPIVKFSLKEREYDITPSTSNPNHSLLCLAHPLQLSVDPTICYIKNAIWGNITPETDEQINTISGKDISKFSNTDYSKELEQINAFTKINDASSSNENGIINIVKPIAESGINELSELNSQCLQKYNRTIYSLMDDALINSEFDQILTAGDVKEDSSIYNERLKAIETNFTEELRKKKEENQELTEQAASQSKYLNSKTKDYFLNNDPYSELGIIENIYLNLQFLYSLSLDNNLESQDKKEKQEINIYDFLKNIMSQISDSVGNLNDFDIHIDPLDGIARIIDINYVDESSRNDAYEKAFILEIHGLKSTARSYKLESQIFPEQSTMIAIGAQAQGGALGINSNTLIDFNKNLIDRILPKKEDANITEEDPLISIREQKDALEQNLKIIYKFLGDNNKFWVVFSNAAFDTNSASSYKGALRDIIAYYQSLSKSNSKNRAIIPTKLSIELDGIGGLIIGHLFRIPESLLPRGYKGLNGVGSKLGYIITGISHKLDGKDWSTGIEAQTIILDEPSGDKVAFKEILKDSILLTSLGNLGEITDTARNNASQYSKSVYEKAAKYAKLMMKELNITDTQAAGIFGNLIYESGGTLSPNIVEGKRGFNSIDVVPIGTDSVGVGWAQWTNGRKEKTGEGRLDKFIFPNGKRIFKSQLTDEYNYNYLIKEIKNDYKYVLNDIKNTSTVKASSDIFLVKFERPKDQGDAQKQRRAAIGEVVLSYIRNNTNISPYIKAPSSTTLPFDQFNFNKK
jgi:hypothetical protein